MEVRLRKNSGDGGDAIVVMVPTFLIGRERDCDLHLTCPMVSRTHCELIIRDDYVTVRDLNSRNGTWVNHESVVSEKQLFSGDKLGLGTCSFEVLIDPTTDHGIQIEESIPVLLDDRARAASDASGGQPACPAC